MRDLSAEFSARKLAREAREASLKLGRRFAELLNGIQDRAQLESDLHYCVAFGAAGAALEILCASIVLAYLSQSIAGLVSCCQRLKPLGQVAASQILWSLNPAIVRA